MNRGIGYIHKTVTYENPIASDIFTPIKGSMFPRWIDSVSGSARANGRNESELIDNPAYIIEDILRTWCFREQTIVTSVTSTTIIVVSGLKSSTDDYYNNAIYINATTGFRGYIADYAGSTKTLTLNDSDTGVTANDNIILSNIDGDNRINANSFDIVGAGIMESGTATSTSAGKLVDSAADFTAVKVNQLVYNITDGTRATVLSVDSGTQLTISSDIMASGESYQVTGLRYGWDFAKSLSKKEYASDTISQILFDSHCILFNTYGGYKIVALEKHGSPATWTTPLNKGGENWLVSTELTTVLDIFTDFTVNWSLDTGSGEYANKVNVNSSGYTDYLTPSGGGLMTLCASAETDYRI